MSTQYPDRANATALAAALIGDDLDPGSVIERIAREMGWHRHVR